MKSKNLKHGTKVKIIILTSVVLSLSIGSLLFNSTLRGISEALESILLFVSIIIGFIGASLSMFATVSESKFATKLKDSPKSKKQFIYTLGITLIIGVLLVGLTIIYQLLIANDASAWIMHFVNYFWLFLIPLFLGMAYLIIDVILKILFAN